ncbi:MAG: hypothetical protein CVV18_09220 [Gammaproteobacteria bacterium HGW-Gammaproteobacteria-8]|nr:MAG: hypothetical protein CVV18_09220 [Gammaproteobacteria bacterium HGW-Gammaproteobacteria-8]
MQEPRLHPKMSTQRPRSIAKILEQVGSSGQMPISLKARQLADLSHRVQACLPADLAGHCHVIGLRDGCLRLATDTPAWAARLRFQAPRLVQQLRQRGAVTLHTVQVQINPVTAPREAPARKPRMTAENAWLLEQTARSIKDPGLARALVRLARRGIASGH